LTEKKIYISGTGIICPLGNDVISVKDSIRNDYRGLTPLSLFDTPDEAPLPAGEIKHHLAEDIANSDVPRTHQLANIAASQAMAGQNVSPDAIVLGTTTGGMFSSETCLKNKETAPELFKYHSIGSVAEDIASKYNCIGPVITISTACSSGTVAIKIAMEMLRQGKATHVLAGGADSLCRLTYYGFKSLQLIDPEGSRPLDKNRRGMNVAEGAAMLLLSVQKSNDTIAEVLGAGLSCDAYHPTAPHPQGDGALRAMNTAIQDAEISLVDIDYINLHGTGTYDNDLSEARAIRVLFPNLAPLLSSVKGASGHSLAASGAIEAVISTLAITDNLIPANTGLQNIDPELHLNPVKKPIEKSVSAVLSNSFGFGGNNASVIIGATDKFDKKSKKNKTEYISILGCACLTGAGDTAKTLSHIHNGEKCNGVLSLKEISANLSPKKVRRLKRLPRLALSLSKAAFDSAGNQPAPSSVFLGTGWGALSETDDFLSRLFESDGQFSSPTSFVGSVHNSPGSHIALEFQSTKANITTSGSDCSFEQALLTAELMAGEISDSFLVAGTDEAHPSLSPLFDPSINEGDLLSDGGGSFLLKKADNNSGLKIRLEFYENTKNNPKIIASLVDSLGGADKINRNYGVLFAGMPLGCRKKSENQLSLFLSLNDFESPVVDYRKLTGEFASASAVAAVIAAKWVESGQIPETISGSQFDNGSFKMGYCSETSVDLSGKGILIVGFGHFITAMEVTP